MNKRLFLTFVFLSAVLVFGLTTTALVYAYALPRPKLIDLGPVSNYHPSLTPYFVRGEDTVFVVNTGEKLMILVAVPPHPKACLARWMIEDAKFMEPCLGSQYWLDGTYILGLSPRNMDQYASKIDENGHLLIDVDRKILGDEHQ